jgi:hypothetical protein
LAANDLSSQKEALVIAAFESNSLFPATKQELLKQDKSKIFQVHITFYYFYLFIFDW